MHNQHLMGEFCAAMQSSTVIPLAHHSKTLSTGLRWPRTHGFSNFNHQARFDLELVGISQAQVGKFSESVSSTDG
jgi:hypothetical protein